MKIVNHYIKNWKMEKNCNPQFSKKIGKNSVNSWPIFKILVPIHIYTLWPIYWKWFFNSVNPQEMLTNQNRLKTKILEFKNWQNFNIKDSFENLMVCWFQNYPKTWKLMKNWLWYSSIKNLICKTQIWQNCQNKGKMAKNCKTLNLRISGVIQLF